MDILRMSETDNIYYIVNNKENKNYYEIKYI